MARKKLRDQPYELLRELLNNLKTVAEADIAEAGYPTDREELRARVFERARHLCSTFEEEEEELERLDPTLIQMLYSLSLLDNIKAAENCIADGNTQWLPFVMFEAGRSAFMLGSSADEKQFSNENSKYLVSGIQSKLGGQRRWGGPAERAARKAVWQKALDSIHSRNRTRSYTHLSELVADKMANSKHPESYKRSARTIRDVCDKPIKETRK